MRLSQLETGEVFELAGYEWILLEHDIEVGKSLVVTKECVVNDFKHILFQKEREECELPYGGKILANDCGLYPLPRQIDDRVFKCEGESNDFGNSALRSYLNNEFLGELIREGLDEDDILYTDFDLWLLDYTGEGDYGFCRDKVGLLTTDQYRKHIEVLRLDTFSLFVTPSTDGSWFNRFVSPDGSLQDYDSRFREVDVRPALYLKSDVSVQTDKETSLEDYSSVELLQELSRRETEQIQRANRTRRS